MQDFVQTVLGQLHADDQHHHCHRQTGQILEPGVAVGVVLIGGLFRQLEADQAHDVGGCVGQVVDGIRRDGDAAEYGAGDELACKQQQVAEDAHHTGHAAVGAAHGGVAGVLMVFYKKPDQGFGHVESFLSCGKPNRIFSIHRFIIA